VAILILAIYIYGVHHNVNKIFTGLGMVFRKHGFCSTVLYLLSGVIMVLLGITGLRLFVN